MFLYIFGTDEWWEESRESNRNKNEKIIKIKVEHAKGKKEKFFRQSPHLLDIIMNMLFYLLVD